jgi:tripartite motif-containing protein 56
MSVMSLCEAHDNSHPATWRCADCDDHFCDELAAAHRRARGTKSHQLSQLLSEKAGELLTPTPQSVTKLPMCTLHNKPFGTYDRTCQRLLCSDVCQYLDQHSKCDLTALLREKEERVDMDQQQLQSLVKQMDVEATLQRLAMYQATSHELQNDIDQDKAFVLEQLEAHYTKVYKCINVIEDHCSG